MTTKNRTRRTYPTHPSPPDTLTDQATAVLADQGLLWEVLTRAAFTDPELVHRALSLAVGRLRSLGREVGVGTIGEETKG